MLTLALFACGDLQSGSQALAPASPSPLPSPTPLPSGVVDPQPLVQRVKGMTGVVLRIDDIATKLMPSADYLGNSIVLSPAANAPGTVWVVAVLGELAPSFGVIAIPNYSCGLFAFRADTGEMWSSGGGSLSKCQPYFARSLTPPDAPRRCVSDTYENGLPRDNTFSRTSPGPFTITPVRDDAWRQPTIVVVRSSRRRLRGAFPTYRRPASTHSFANRPWRSCSRPAWQRHYRKHCLHLTGLYGYVATMPYRVRLMPPDISM